MMRHLPTEPGKYRASKNVILYVSASCSPYFVVQFRYSRDGERKDVTSKFYVRSPLEFMAVQRAAINHAKLMFGEIRKAKDAFLKQEVLRKEAEHRARVEQQAANRQHLAERARQDVQYVWSIYGPELEFNKPFYIFQWG